MDDTARKEIERRLEQSRRLASSANDPTTSDRIKLLIADLERQQAGEKK
jgi:hypothetical protein